jgi:HEPN domain-containing protein
LRRVKNVIIQYPKNTPKKTSPEGLDAKLKNAEIPYHILDYKDKTFTDAERRYLERQLRSLFAYVGCATPKEVEVDGVVIPLEEIVWRLITKEKLSEDEKNQVEVLLKVLKRKAEHDRELIKEYELNDEEAEKVYFEACGLIRAVSTLREIEGEEAKDVKKEVANKKIEDAKKILELVKRIK